MMTRLLSLVLCFLIITTASVQGADIQRPSVFVDAKKIIPSLFLDIRYYTPHNFVGVRVDGYEAPKCLLTEKAANALAQVQKELAAFNLSLKVYDCYRPQRAVNHFIRWAKDLNDTKTKNEFYPIVEKKNLFKDGYVAEKSSHSRGSTVDLTIVPLPWDPSYGSSTNPCKTCPSQKKYIPKGLDMGTVFDFFSPFSHTKNTMMTPVRRAHRLLLKTLMEKHGFENYDKEWWHYTLKNEPYPNTYFDFPVK